MKVINVPGPAKKYFDRAVKDLHNTVAKVGWFESAKYEDGTPVAYIATIQEYGDPSHNIPPRPFLRPTVKKEEPTWTKIVANNSKKIMRGELTAPQAMEQIGLKAAGDIRKAISDLQSPPLSQRTINARIKKRANQKAIGLLTKPLVETGLMLNSLTNTVETK